MRQVIIWANPDPIQWRIYAVLGGDEFINTIEKQNTIQNTSFIYNFMKQAECEQNFCIMLSLFVNFV